MTSVVRFHRITDPGDPHMDAIRPIYQTSFPPDEQRTPADNHKVLSHPDFHCMALVDGTGRTTGALTFWDFAKLRYLEHFAMDPGHRSGGHGSRALRELAAISPDRLIVVEIDMPVDPISRRRLGFYERQGYVLNEGVYRHAPYQPGYAAREHRLLSLGRAMTAPEREAFEIGVETIVMGYTKDWGTPNE